MQISVLVCKADGTQIRETREVPDDFFAALEPEESGPVAAEQ